MYGSSGWRSSLAGRIAKLADHIRINLVLIRDWPLLAEAVTGVEVDDLQTMQTSHCVQLYHSSSRLLEKL